MDNSCKDPIDTDRGIDRPLGEIHDAQRSSTNINDGIERPLRDFPKNIGIIYLVEKESKHSFDEVSCSHLLLQINNNQKIFNFKLIDIGRGKLSHIALTPDQPVSWEGQFTSKLYELITRIKSVNDYRKWNIDYWLGITNLTINSTDENFWRHSYYLVWNSNAISKDGKLEKATDTRDEIMGMVTSKSWEKKNSPPSVFEFISIASFMCSLHFLNKEYGGNLEGHSTSGCIFDHTLRTNYLRISTSNPFVCSPCQTKLESLERIIRGRHYNNVPSLLDNVNKILSRKWMGSQSEINSPIYNLKKNYKYDVEKNSGYYKGIREKFKESVADKLADWTLGNVVGGIIGGLLVVLFYVVFKIKP
jgi:hypothetical protein